MPTTPTVLVSDMPAPQLPVHLPVQLPVHVPGGADPVRGTAGAGWRAHPLTSALTDPARSCSGRQPSTRRARSRSPAIHGTAADRAAAPPADPNADPAADAGAKSEAEPKAEPA